MEPEPRAPAKWAAQVVLHGEPAPTAQHSPTAAIPSAPPAKRDRTGRKRPAREAEQKQRQANKEHQALQAEKLREHQRAQREAALDAATKSAQSRHADADKWANRRQEYDACNTPQSHLVRAERKHDHAMAEAMEVDALINRLHEQPLPKECRCSLCGRLCDMGVPRWCARCKAARATGSTAVPPPPQPAAASTTVPPPPAEESAAPAAPPQNERDERSVQWKPLVPSRPSLPPRVVVEADTMTNKATCCSAEGFLADLVCKVIRDKYNWDLGTEHIIDYDKICDHAGCEFYMDPDRFGPGREGRKYTKHKCARYTGDRDKYDTDTWMSDEVYEHLERTDPEGCEKRSREELELLQRHAPTDRIPHRYQPRWVDGTYDNGCR